MIKALKLQKGIVVIIFGVIALVISQVMSSKHSEGSSYVLALSGVFFIFGALVLIYPILFAKKVDPDGDKVELEPVAKEPIDESNL